MSVYGTLPDITRLSERVIRIMGGNPGKFTLQGSNTYLVGTGTKRILIDTGEGRPHWIEQLKKVLSEERAEVSAALITHWHHDHVGGIANLREISPNTIVYKNDPWDSQQPIEDGQIFSVEGATLKAYHTPGHTQDHMCFFLEQEFALFTGDSVLGHGTSVFEDLAMYLNSLRRTYAIADLKGKGYPGHGEVLDEAKAAINGYILHRQARETQVIAVLKEGHPLGYDDSITAMEIVHKIYKEVPRDLYPAAEKGVLQILGKLETENRVAREGQRWVLRERSNIV
ncbi:beta-lactamase-like protein [Kalaharituber pfeilii]|nr:beta-lactamase-like protein [Kalaharituber pfeilii]